MLHKKSVLQLDLHCQRTLVIEKNMYIFALKVKQFS